MTFSLPMSGDDFIFHVVEHESGVVFSVTDPVNGFGAERLVALGDFFELKHEDVLGLYEVLKGEALEDKAPDTVEDLILNAKGRGEVRMANGEAGIACGEATRGVAVKW